LIIIDSDELPAKKAGFIDSKTRNENRVLNDFRRTVIGNKVRMRMLKKDPHVDKWA